MHMVRPKRTRPDRMQRLEALPVFVDLKHAPVLVAGDGDGAIWKAELLAAAGAHVRIYAPRPSSELQRLCDEPPAGRMEIVPRLWQPEDLSGTRMAVGELEGEEADRFAAAARANGVPVNIVDAPAQSDFSFGTIVNRAPVTIAIGTGGTAPVLGQAIRAKIEALLHPSLGSWAAMAGGMRARVKALFDMGPARRAFWRRFADRALAARAEPDAAAMDDLFQALPDKMGYVTLVGAGPGDPEYLTIKALRALQSADIILYDRLVSPETLELARREARRMLVGKAGGGAHCSQDDINALMVRLARGGKHVVRLKGGDPMVFARAAEEIAACRDAGLRVEIVPGITAALGAAAALQVPLTDRDSSARVQFATGHAKTGHVPEHDWQAFADDKATTVLYMAASKLAVSSRSMIAAGLDPHTPACAISAATTPRQETTFAPIADLPAALLRAGHSGPVLIMIGPTVADSPSFQSAEDMAVSAMPLQSQPAG